MCVTHIFCRAGKRQAWKCIRLWASILVASPPIQSGSSETRTPRGPGAWRRGPVKCARPRLQDFNLRVENDYKTPMAAFRAPAEPIFLRICTPL